MLEVFFKVSHLLLFFAISFFFPHPSDAHLSNTEIPLFLVFSSQQFYKVVPIKDIRNLYVTFPIPDLQKYYKSNPGHYLGHLIGHEGPGSLLSELKSKGRILVLRSN